VVEKKYVDVNVFVYWLAKHPEYGEVAREWIRRIEHGKRGEYVTSTLTLYELAVILAGLAGKSLRDRELIKIIINAVTSLAGLEITTLEQKDCIKALELMEKHNLDYEDSLHLAVAMRERAVRIISNDKDFDKTPIKRSF